MYAMDYNVRLICCLGLLIVETGDSLRLCKQHTLEARRHIKEFWTLKWIISLLFLRGAAHNCARLKYRILNSGSTLEAGQVLIWRVSQLRIGMQNH